MSINASKDQVLQWTPADVSAWLHSIGLNAYAEKFQTLSVDGQILLLDLDRNTLTEDIGVPAYDVDRVLTNVQVLRNRVEGRAAPKQAERPPRRAQTVPASRRPMLINPPLQPYGGAEDPFSDGADDLATMLKRGELFQQAQPPPVQRKKSKWKHKVLTKEEEYRRRLHAILVKHRPKSLDNLEKMLTKHRDYIHTWYVKLCTKYNETPLDEYDEKKEKRRLKKERRAEKGRQARNMTSTVTDNRSSQAVQRVQSAVQPDFANQQAVVAEANLPTIALGEEAGTEQLHESFQKSLRSIEQQRADLARERREMEAQQQDLASQLHQRHAEEISRLRDQLVKATEITKVPDDKVRSELSMLKKEASRNFAGDESSESVETWIISGDSKEGSERFARSLRNLDRRMPPKDFETLIETVIKRRGRLKDEERDIAKELADLHRSYLRAAS